MEDVAALVRRGVSGGVFPLVILSVMTFLLMPVATRVVKRWLYPDGG